MTRYEAVLAVTCPWCDSGMNVPCRDHSGRPLRRIRIVAGHRTSSRVTFHSARLKASFKQHPHLKEDHGQQDQ